MRVHICTPAYEGRVHAGYAQSMVQAGFVLAKCGIPLSATVVRNGMFIDVARSLMVQQFLQTDATHLMFVDSDLAFDPYAIAGLVNSGLPVSCGVYRQREAKVKYNITLTGNEIVYRDGWIQADRVGAGFLCITREVLEEMSSRAEVFKTSSGEVPLVFRLKYDAPRMLGEDVSFCDDYTALYKEGVFDEPIWIWPDIDFTHDVYPCNFHQHLLDIPSGE